MTVSELCFRTLDCHRIPHLMGSSYRNLPDLKARICHALILVSSSLLTEHKEKS